VEILDDQEQRLDLTLPEQEPFDRLQDLLPTLGRIEVIELGVVVSDIQQRKQRCQKGLQRAVEHQELAGHAFADRSRVVTLLDQAIRLQ
jgi:hypothetical protein